MRLLAGCTLHPPWTHDTRSGAYTPHAELPRAQLWLSRRVQPPAPGEPNPADTPKGNEKADAEAIRSVPQSQNTARPALGRLPHPTGRDSCTLTPAHHLRGAIWNSELSATLGQTSTKGKGLTAPRLVHALVRARPPLSWGKGVPHERR